MPRMQCFLQYIAVSMEHSVLLSDFGRFLTAILAVKKSRINQHEFRIGPGWSMLVRAGIVMSVVD